MEAGALQPNRKSVHLPAGMREAWDIFCCPGTKQVEFYECRGTYYIKVVNCLDKIKLQEIEEPWLRKVSG
jgi:hypothetical protein